MESVSAIISVAVFCAMFSVNQGLPLNTTDIITTTTNSSEHYSTPATTLSNHEVIERSSDDEIVDENDNDFETRATLDTNADAATNTVRGEAFASEAGDIDDDTVDERVHDGTMDSNSAAPKNLNESQAITGFPWWSLLIIIAVTVAIVVIITVLFYHYNRRLENERREASEKGKRASELIVDSWIAASLSSLGSANDVDCDYLEDVVFPSEMPCVKT